MILLDLSQVMIATLMAQLGHHTNAEVDENMLRHMIINSVRYNNHKMSGKYGELILCCDGKNVWRKDVYPYYKAGRKAGRDKSEINWNQVFESLHKIKDEMKEFLPYRVIEVDRVEADDIIGTIVHKEGKLLGGDSILILSSDKDYIQLHKYSNVEQYDPVRKKYITHPDPENYLYEHVLRGDRGDDIPNVLSQDDTFVMGIRQKQLRQSKIEKWKSGELIMDDDTKKNLVRNRTLVDLSQIPQEYKDQIIAEYEKPNLKDRSKLLSYFMDKKLKHLTSHISEF